MKNRIVFRTEFLKDKQVLHHIERQDKEIEK
jgi:hypothetical protein